MVFNSKRRVTKQDKSKFDEILPKASNKYFLFDLLFNHYTNKIMTSKFTLSVIFDIYWIKSSEAAQIQTKRLAVPSVVTVGV